MRQVPDLYSFFCAENENFFLNNSYSYKVHFTLQWMDVIIKKDFFFIINSQHYSIPVWIVNDEGNITACVQFHFSCRLAYPSVPCVQMHPIKTVNLPGYTPERQHTSEHITLSKPLRPS